MLKTCSEREQLKDVVLSVLTWIQQMKCIFLSALVIGSLTVISIPANADTVNFYSGVSSDGTYDAQVHMLTGPNDGPITDSLSSPATFSAALNGSSAFMVEPHAAWASTPITLYTSDSPNWSWDDYNAGLYDPSISPYDVTGYSPARWISSDPNGGAGGAFTALYAISFTLPEFNFASISVKFAADQTLGTTADDGLFLNGNALVGSGGGNYADTTTYINNDVSSLLHAGDNTLYIYNVNYGGPAGVIFDATVNFIPSPAPEPSVYALFGLGAFVGLICYHRRGLRRSAW